jgi:hypothetical protein
MARQNKFQVTSARTFLKAPAIAAGMQDLDQTANKL